MHILDSANTDAINQYNMIIAYLLDVFCFALLCVCR